MPVDVGAWVGAAAPFVEYLEEWQDKLTPLPLEEMVRQAEGPDHVAIFCVDVTNGFCHEGRLASERVRSIIDPIADLMTRAHDLGVRNFVLPEDNHPADSEEFGDFPVHCVAGTSEAKTVPELTALPFSSEFVVMPKRSLSVDIGTGLDRWLEDRREVTHRIVVGDCTDICVYQLAMHLRLTAVVQNLSLPVIVPADCVNTYDVSVDVAKEFGILPHPGELMHRIFLLHMRLCGVQVVSSMP